MSLPPGIADHVRTYLASPQVDLQTVSAKQIRKHLSTIFPDLDIKALRSDIDEISIPIFHEIKEESESALKQAQTQSQPPPPTNHSSSSLPPLALPSRGIPGVVKAPAPVVEPPPSNKAKSSSPRATPSAPRTNSSKNSKSSSSKNKKRKSAAYVDSDDENEQNGQAKTSKKPKNSRKQKTNGESGDGTGSNKGIHQELNCSAALSELIGVATCSRPQVVKKLWEYIKSKDLQDPQDKRQIRCDDALKKIFKQNSVHMFTMNKLLGDHLSKEEEVIRP